MEKCHDEDVMPLAVRLIFLGHRVTSLVERRLAKYEYNHTQAALIGMLRRHPGLIGQEMVGPLPVEAPSVTRALQSLERRGLVQRRPHPSDGRANVFELTAAGRGEAQLLAKLLRETSDELEADLSPEQRQALREAMATILTCVKHTRGVSE
ncbi:MAG: MarR family transcriptional regulator [Chloroflexi bacterium]|nr:MarR family transcriptional regulator [Chloroflexota bacterium]